MGSRPGQDFWSEIWHFVLAQARVNHAKVGRRLNFEPMDIAVEAMSSVDTWVAKRATATTFFVFSESFRIEARKYASTALKTKLIDRLRREPPFQSSIVSFEEGYHDTADSDRFASGQATQIITPEQTALVRNLIDTMLKRVTRPCLREALTKLADDIERHGTINSMPDDILEAMGSSSQYMADLRKELRRRGIVVDRGFKGSADD